MLFLAGDLTEEYRLRGFDAIHLAAAVVLQRKVKEPVTFACWDGRPAYRQYIKAEADEAVRLGEKSWCFAGVLCNPCPAAGVLVVVKVFRLDRERIVRDLERWAQGLPDDVLAVILFGSLARGDHSGFSDADLLVVLSRSDKPFLDRIPALLPRGVGVPVDVFPYTCQELATMWAEGAGVVRVALEEGLFLRGGPQDILRVISPGHHARGLGCGPLSNCLQFPGQATGNKMTRVCVTKGRNGDHSR